MRFGLVESCSKGKHSISAYQSSYIRGTTVTPQLPGRSTTLLDIRQPSLSLLHAVLRPLKFSRVRERAIYWPTDRFNMGLFNLTALHTEQTDNTSQ